MACGHCAENQQCRKPQYRMQQCGKSTVQNSRCAEMGNVPIALSSLVKVSLRKH